MNGDLTVDVLIVTRTRELVLSCLEHLGRQRLPHTVYVADNGANRDGASDAIRARYPGVHVFTNQQNLGFGRAVNELARLGTGNVIVLVNDDMDAEPQFLERLVAPLAEPSVGMVAGLTLQPGAEGLIDGFGIEVDCTLLAFNRLRHRPSVENPGRLLGPSGGAAAYRRTAWEAAGGFDPHLFMYAEDQDLALRLRLAGWQAAAAPDARARHLGGATAGLDSPAQRYHGGFGRGFILRRYGVLRTRHAPRAAVIELLTVLYGLATARTLVPLSSRLAGWRAAGGSQREIPLEGVDKRISMRESLRRLRHER